MVGLVVYDPEDEARAFRSRYECCALLLAMLVLLSVAVLVRPRGQAEGEDPGAPVGLRPRPDILEPVFVEERDGSR